jgi:hypothetical protein
MFDMIVSNETKNEDRKQKMIVEVQKLFNGLPGNLDSRSRELFNSKFTALKSFIFDLNQTSWSLQLQTHCIFNTTPLLFQ